MRFYFLVYCFIFCPSLLAWQPLTTGIDYRTILRSYPQILYPRNVKLHVFRIQQGQFKLRIHSFHNLPNQQFQSIANYRKQHQALIVMSGGFYQKTGFRKPVGLVVIQQKPLFRLTQSFSGVVWIKDNQLYLSPTDQFSLKTTQPDYAIQGYPRIIDPINQPGIHTQGTRFTYRAALCTQSQNFMLLITDKSFFGLSLYELSQIAGAPEAQDGLACDIAINLDGGPAPGIAVDPKLLNLHIQEGWQLPNIIAIHTK